MQPAPLSDVLNAAEKAQRLEDAIKASDMELVDVPVAHYFSPGVYAREMRVPAGMVIVGKIHRYAQLNILSQGTVRVQTEDGVHILSAPHTFVGPAGAKRVFYTETDIVWTVIHGTEETDLEKLETKFIAPSFEAYLESTKLLEGES